MPWPSDWEPVLISIDFEAWEKNNSYITEVGLAVLDTKDIVKIAPGQGAKNWIEKIRPLHFRVKENLAMVNSEFVAGQPENFNFGQSEILSKSDIKEKLQQIIFDLDPEFQPEDPYEPPYYRSFALIGHNLQADRSFLHKGFDMAPWTSHWCLPDSDTQMIYGGLHQSGGGSSSLEGVLRELGIEYDFLHNAGNDAMYTMQAFLIMGLKESLMAGAARQSEMEASQKS